MQRGVQHNDRAIGGDAVEVGRIHPPVGEINRVKAPSDKRCVFIFARGLNFFQLGDHFINAFQPRPNRAVGPFAVIIADIMIIPEHALHHMAMPFNKTGQQAALGKIRIQCERPPCFLPAINIVCRSNAQNMSVAHGNMGGVRQVRIHGANTLRLINDTHIIPLFGREPSIALRHGLVHTCGNS